MNNTAAIQEVPTLELDGLMATAMLEDGEEIEEAKTRLKEFERLGMTKAAEKAKVGILSAFVKAKGWDTLVATPVKTVPDRLGRYHLGTLEISGIENRIGDFELIPLQEYEGDIPTDVITKVPSESARSAVVFKKVYHPDPFLAWPLLVKQSVQLVTGGNRITRWMSRAKNEVVEKWVPTGYYIATAKWGDEADVGTPSTSISAFASTATDLLASEFRQQMRLQQERQMTLARQAGLSSFGGILGGHK